MQREDWDERYARPGLLWSAKPNRFLVKVGLELILMVGRELRDDLIGRSEFERRRSETAVGAGGKLQGLRVCFSEMEAGRLTGHLHSVH